MPNDVQEKELQGDIILLIPALRGFAVTLTKSATEADDLVQETLLKALDNIGQFVPGTNLRAWLFTIARNTFYSNYRKRRRSPVSDMAEAGTLYTPPDQEWRLQMQSVHKALEHLPLDQQEALMLVGGAGLSYIEAAEVCGCAVGTIKSRVSRARARLLQLLGTPEETTTGESAK